MRSILSLLVLALPLALAGHQPNVNHRELAKRAKGDLETRGSGARWSFYSTGLGACGKVNNDGDFIVALNQQTFGYSYPSQYCFKMIRMTYNGKTTEAQITDSCPGCPYDGLDLSPSLFSFFASQDLGIIYGTWEFVDGSGGGGDPDPTTTTKKTTTTHHTTTSTTHTTPTPTTTYTPPPPPPTTTHTTTKQSSTTTTSSTTSSKASDSAKPSPSPSPSPSSSAAPSVVSSDPIAAASGTVSSTSTENPEILYNFAQAFLGLTQVIVAGGNAE
ncbi:RlpA-like double-psi beta-barrel-protein domain-containing protein-containing protein [Mycena capillaripes]|nr:RlpA-like double-psi beta-barrel-protein domain-containing protein-containing protein [Mycena capillaripes]